MARVELISPFSRPKCEAVRTEKYYRDDAGVTYYCERPAKWKIDGACLCGQHAGQAAISILMKEQSK